MIDMIDDMRVSISIELQCPYESVYSIQYTVFTVSVWVSISMSVQVSSDHGTLSVCWARTRSCTFYVHANAVAVTFTKTYNQPNNMVTYWINFYCYCYWATCHWEERSSPALQWKHWLSSSKKNLCARRCKFHKCFHLSRYQRWTLHLQGNPGLQV